MAPDKRRYILIQTGANTLTHGCESVDLLRDTASDIGPCAREAIAEIDDIIVNADGEVSVACFKHGISPCVGPVDRNRTNSYKWEDILDFTVDDDHECEEELKLMAEGLKTGGITHVYVAAEGCTPICFAIMQVGS